MASPATPSAGVASCLEEARTPRRPRGLPGESRATAGNRSRCPDRRIGPAAAWSMTAGGRPPSSSVVGRPPDRSTIPGCGMAPPGAGPQLLGPRLASRRLSPSTQSGRSSCCTVVAATPRAKPGSGLGAHGLRSTLQHLLPGRDVAPRWRSTPSTGRSCSSAAFFAARSSATRGTGMVKLGGKTLPRVPGREPTMPWRLTGRRSSSCSSAAGPRSSTNSSAIPGPGMERRGAS